MDDMQEGRLYVWTHADPEPGLDFTKVDANAGTAFAAEHLVLLLGIKLIRGQAVPRISVPYYVLAGRI